MAIYPDLQGRVVLVTGGGSGICEAIVRRFAAQRATVGFIDIPGVRGDKRLYQSALRGRWRLGAGCRRAR